MNLKLDHIVHFIKNHPNEAVTIWKDKGFHAIIGGSHEQWGTSNSLLYIGNSYLEFLSVEDTKIANQSDNPLITQLIEDLKNGEGIGNICFRTDNIMELQKKLETIGCQTHPIFQGSRKRKDGSTISWKMLFIKNSSGLPNPFFIDWEQDDEFRLNELKQLGMLDDNLEKAKIAAIFIATKDSEKAAREWVKLFQFELKDTYQVSEKKEKRTSILVRSTEIIFCQPLTEGTAAWEVIKTRGERPFSVQFTPPLVETLELIGSRYA